MTFSSRFPSFNVDLQGRRWGNKAGPKVDWQFTPQMRLTSHYTRYRVEIHINTGGALNSPVDRTRGRADCQSVLCRLQSGVELAKRRTGFPGSTRSCATFCNRPPDGEPAGTAGRQAQRPSSGKCSPVRNSGGVPVLSFSGYNFGNTNNPQSSGERVYSIRDDFTTLFDMQAGTMCRAGLEYIRYTMDTAWCNGCNGTLSST